MNDINWYEFVIKNHFNKKNKKPPPFFTEEFVAFKLPNHIIPPVTKRDAKLHYIKHFIFNNIDTIKTEKLISLICDASFVFF